MVKKCQMLTNSFSNSSVLILFATLLGALTGWSSIPYLLSAAHGVSHIFVNLLALISLPIIFLSIVATISGMESFDEMKILGQKVLKYTLLTTVIAAIVALTLFVLINPVGSIIQQTTSPQTTIGLNGYFSFLAKIVPSNFVQALSDNANVMSVVFLALLFSLSILSLEHEHKVFLHTLFASLFEALLKITRVIIFLMPLGIWAFVTNFVHGLQTNSSGLQHLFLYFVCILGANLVQGVIILPALLAYKGLSPRKIALGMREALTVAFFSKSSNTTLPLTIKCAQENVGISARVARFTLPLCATINMNGCAAFILITVLFVAQSNGMHFGLFDLIAWVFIASIAAVGNAGVPMGCYFLTSAFLATLGVPLDLLGVILPVYALIDMVETTLNVWSDACVAAVVDKEINP